MISINLISGQNWTLHNFAGYLLSDTASPSDSENNTVKPVVSRTLTLTESSDSVTRSIVVSTSTPDAPKFRAMSERLLRLVVSRRPRALQPNPQQAPDYLLAYVTETLECGHKVDFHFNPPIENLTAKRRVCNDCAEVTKKKPVQSVRFPSRQKEAA